MWPDMSPEDYLDGCPELIASLYLEAGRIMEDASPELALRIPTEGKLLNKRLHDARLAGEDVLKLISAAEVLSRRYIDV